MKLREILEQVWEELKLPFAEELILSETVTGDKPGTTKALKIVNSGHYIDRLDSVFEPDGWKREFRNVSSTAKSVTVECRIKIPALGFKTSWCAAFADYGPSRTSGEAIVVSRTKAFKAACAELGIGRHLNSDIVVIPPAKHGMVGEIMEGEKKAPPKPDQVKIQEVEQKIETPQKENLDTPKNQEEPKSPSVPDGEMFDPRGVDLTTLSVPQLKSVIAKMGIDLEAEKERLNVKRAGHKVLKQIINEFFLTPEGMGYMNALPDREEEEEIIDDFTPEEEKEKSEQGEKKSKPEVSIDDLTFGARGLVESILINDYLAQFGYDGSNWEETKAKFNLEHEEWNEFCMTCTREEVQALTSTLG